MSIPSDTLCETIKMHSKTLAVLFLSATAVTALDLDSMNDSSDDYYSSLMSGLNSLCVASIFSIVIVMKSF